MIAVLLLALPSAAAARRETVRILFVGNSLTFYHRMPTLLEAFARGDGAAPAVETEWIVRGGETLARHVERTDDGAPLKVIAAGGWDYVVIQENGRVAASGEVDSRPPARRLVEAARRAGAKPVFYMTWAYRDHPQSLGRVQRTYYLLGSELRAPVAPVGEAWRLAREEAPEIELFDGDGIHPSPAGSYLAACVLYATILQRQPPSSGAAAGAGEGGSPVAPEQARRLRTLARRALEIYPQPFSP